MNPEYLLKNGARTNLKPDLSRRELINRANCRRTCPKCGGNLHLKKRDGVYRWVCTRAGCSGTKGVA